ncbi:nuclear transport factor 2 family protein [Tunturiibacter gelidiferens]|uniref:nuclear transport factor 2 family protein n=1 Tax=Tunturiibacter gelidiferens TaxID=3069689 RepID=UPI003D9BD2EA
MQSDRELLASAYKHFNVRDIDSVLNLMYPDVDWPNGLEGGRVHGHTSVRDYWTRQWAILDPHVEPTGFASDADGRTMVQVHQVVRDLAGKVLLDHMVQHVYLVQDSLIRSMEIRESPLS